MVYAPWDPPDQEDEELEEGEEDPEDDSDVVSAILTWEEQGSNEISVDMGLAEKAIYLQVNGTGIRLEADAVRQALLHALREALGF